MTNLGSLATQLRVQCKRLSWLTLMLGMLVWPCLGLAAPKQVLLLLSEDVALYREAANAIREGLESELAGGKLVIRTGVAGEAGSLAASVPETLIVPLGAKAAYATAHLEQPVLAGLLARQSYEKYFISGAASQRRPVSAIYLDQPLGRYVQLVRAVQPHAKSVGVLLGPAQIAAQPALLNVARTAGLQLTSALLNSNAELFSALQDLLPNVDVLLLLPDPLVINRNSVQNLMLSSYRRHVPTLAYSQNLVEAGALAGVFSTTQQIGKQIAETIQSLLPGKSWELPSPVYPKYFTVKINASVARSLEISVPMDAMLIQRMGAGAAL